MNSIPIPAADSIWEKLAPPAGPARPPLSGAAEADLVVVGGGFTGLSAALHAARDGKSIVLLEARRVGFGASGRNNGQVIPTLSRPDPNDLVQRHGLDAERFVTLLRDSASTLFNLVRDNGLACDAEQNGWVQPAHTPGRIAIARRRVEQWSARGADVDLIDKPAMDALLGSERFHGGWIAKTGGTINPLALARELGRLCVETGVSVHEESPVVSLGHSGGAWRVSTAGGTVTAPALVLATHAYTDDLDRDLAHELVPATSWQMATAPISDNLRKVILPGRQAVSDTHGDLHFFRWDREGRLISGGALIVSADGDRRIRDLVAKRLQWLFPMIGDVRFDKVWNGRIAMTDDYHPRLHRFGPKGYGWAGCNGRGVALSVTMGRELARAAVDDDARAIGLPVTPVKPIPFQPIVRRLAPAMLALYRWRDAREIA